MRDSSDTKVDDEAINGIARIRSATSFQTRYRHHCVETFELITPLYDNQLRSAMTQHLSHSTHP